METTEILSEDLRIDCPAQVFSPENFTNPITENPALRKELILGVADWIVKRQFLLNPDTYESKVNRFISQLTSQELKEFIKEFDNNIASILSSFDSQIALVNKYRVEWKNKFLNGEGASDKFLSILKGYFCGNDRDEDELIEGPLGVDEEKTSTNSERLLDELIDSFSD